MSPRHLSAKTNHCSLHKARQTEVVGERLVDEIVEPFPQAIEQATTARRRGIGRQRIGRIGGFFKWRWSMGSGRARLGS